jgi:hypothetical protein
MESRKQEVPSQFDQFIQYKSLAFKFIGHKFTEIALEDTELPEKYPVKNVCAKLSVPLSDRIDETVKLLDMSKRKFIELAIVQALDNANEIMNDVDIFENLRDDGEES